MTYTEADVERLADAANAALIKIRQATATPSGATAAGLERALEPFQPDPDAELAKQVKEICYGATPNGDDRWARIIAAVRAHDRGKA